MFAKITKCAYGVHRKDSELIVKHLYQRSVKRNGKTVKIWYFWYWHNGKQIRKSCKTSVKREALAYISSLSDDDLIPEIKNNSNTITFNDFCTGMFDDDSSYLVKLKNRGIVFGETTLKQKRKYLSMILERFGEIHVKDISAGIIDDWLLRQWRSNSWRNNCLSVFRAILSELYLYKLIDGIPELPPYKRIDTKEKGILYPEEIHSLFPDIPDELISVWRLYASENRLDILIFATMVYTALTTGMRSGEVRALTYSQFIQKDVVLLNAMLDIKGRRIQHLKKGNEKNKRWRCAILPDRTVQMIDGMRRSEGPKESDYVFEFHGKPFSAEYFNRRFKNVLVRNGIDVHGRNITIHSLRFTYNSMMKREISAEDLRLMIGHTSERMTEYYDKLLPIDHLPELIQNKPVIDSVWN